MFHYSDLRYRRNSCTTSPIMFNLVTIRQLIPYAVKVGPAWLRRKLIKLVPNKRVQQAVDIVDTMDSISNDIFRKKREALEKGDEAMLRQVGMGKDIMSVLCKRSFCGFYISFVPADHR